MLLVVVIFPWRFPFQPLKGTEKGTARRCGPGAEKQDFAPEVLFEVLLRARIRAVTCHSAAGRETAARGRLRGGAGQNLVFLGCFFCAQI